MGTGKEQKVTITASTNLSDDEIEKAVKEAEQYAAEDKQKKEEIEVRNNADSLVYQSEKSLEDLKDKLDDADKNALRAEIDKVKEALKGTDNAAIKAASEELSKKFMEIGQKVYQNAAPQGEAAPGQEAPKNDDGTVEADYKEVDNDK